MFPSSASDASWLAYVGCRTTRERNARGRGLAVFRIGADGAWTPLQLLEGLRNPSYLCLHPHAPVLYAVHGDFSEISTFAIDPQGRLERRAVQSTEGRNPVHLALSASGRWLLVGNYASGTVVSLPVAGDGALGPVSSVLPLPGESGPHAQQDGSHPHQVVPLAGGRHFVVPDKGLDALFTVQLDEATGRLEAAGRLALPAGSGPRHLALHPSRPVAWLVGELDRTVMTLALHEDAFVLQGSRSTVPPDCTEGSAAAIELAADARTLFVSNRGHDSIAIFPVASDGEPGAPRWVPTGRTPRFITRRPADDALVVACEDGDTIEVLSSCGAPTPLAQTGSPVCVLFRKHLP